MDKIEISVQIRASSLSKKTKRNKGEKTGINDKDQWGSSTLQSSHIVGNNIKW